MHKIAVAAISLISIFHIDQLPMLLPTYMAIQGGNIPYSGTFSQKFAIFQYDIADMDIIKTVAIWAVSCFAKYHPDVIKMMNLVDKD